MKDLDVILDVEATCQENVNWRVFKSEIIEIGAVATKSGNAQSFMMKPVINPVLTEFCTKLTTITQDQVEIAPFFIEGYSSFIEWVQRETDKPIEDVKWGSWGFYDLNIIIENCSIYHIPTGLSHNNHTNVKLTSLPKLGLTKGGINKALAKLNIAFEGTLHRGVDDAKMIYRIWKEVK